MNRSIFATAVLTCFLISLSACTQSPAVDHPFKLQISKETTFIESPLLPDGTPDYLRAYKSYASQGVTPENNAGYLISQLLGQPWPANTPGGIAPTTAPTTFPSTQPVGDSPTTPPPVVFENWLNYGKTHWDTAPHHDEWVALKAEKQESRVDRTETQPWQAQDFPLLALWLDSQAEPLKNITLAAQRSRYYRPVKPITNISTANLTWWKKPHPGQPSDISSGPVMTHALIMRAMLRAGSGDTVGALEDLQTIRRLARLLRQEPAVMEVLIAGFMEAQSYQAEIVLAKSDILTPVQRQELLSRALTTDEFSFNPQAFNIGERFAQLHIVMEYLRGNRQEIIQVISGLSASYIFDYSASDKPTLYLGDLNQTNWNIVLRTLNNTCDELTEITVEPDEIKQYERISLFQSTHQDAHKAGVVCDFDYFLDKQEKLEAKRAALRETLAQYFRRRPAESQEDYSQRIAIFFLGDNTSLDRTISVIFRPRTYQRQLQLVLALRQFHEATGNYPITLAELTPKYLLKIPNDPFSGQLMKYEKQAQGYLLYSFGLNRKDDGGKTYHEQKEADDIVVKMDH